MTSEVKSGTSTSSQNPDPMTLFGFKSNIQKFLESFFDQYRLQDDRSWSSSNITTGRKQKRWLADDYSELYIEETGGWMNTDAEYQVKYRNGRIGPSELLQDGEFEELNEAVEYAEDVITGEEELEELL